MQHTHTHTYTPNDDRRAKVLYRSVVVVAQLAPAAPSPRKAEKGKDRAVLLWHPARTGDPQVKKREESGHADRHTHGARGNSFGCRHLAQLLSVVRSSILHV